MQAPAGLHIRHFALYRATGLGHHFALVGYVVGQRPRPDLFLVSTARAQRRVDPHHDVAAFGNCGGTRDKNTAEQDGCRDQESENLHTFPLAYEPRFTAGAPKANIPLLSMWPRF